MKINVSSILFFVALNIMSSSYVFSKYSALNSIDEAHKFEIYEGTVIMEEVEHSIILMLEETESKNQKAFWITDGSYEERDELLGLLNKRTRTYSLNSKESLNISFLKNKNKLIGQWKMPSPFDSLLVLSGNFYFEHVRNSNHNLEQSTHSFFFNSFLSRHQIMNEDGAIVALITEDYLEIKQVGDSVYLFHLDCSEIFDVEENRVFSGILTIQSANKAIHFDKKTKCNLSFEIFEDHVTVVFLEPEKSVNLVSDWQPPTFYLEKLHDYNLMLKD